MASAFMTINGVSVPCPSTFTWGLQDVSSSNSGRSDTGYMHKNRVTQKRKLSVSWTALTFSQASKIVNAVDDEYFTVIYPDVKSGNENESRTFYVGDRSAPFKCWWSGNKRMESLSFELVER